MKTLSLNVPWITIRINLRISLFDETISEKLFRNFLAFGWWKTIWSMENAFHGLKTDLNGEQQLSLIVRRKSGKFLWFLASRPSEKYRSLYVYFVSSSILFFIFFSIIFPYYSHYSFVPSPEYISLVLILFHIPTQKKAYVLCFSYMIL